MLVFKNQSYWILLSNNNVHLSVHIPMLPPPQSRYRIDSSSQNFFHDFLQLFLPAGVNRCSAFCHIDYFELFCNINRIIPGLFYSTWYFWNLSMLYLPSLFVGYIPLYRYTEFIYLDLYFISEFSNSAYMLCSLWSLPSGVTLVVMFYYLVKRLWSIAKPILR